MTSDPHRVPSRHGLILLAVALLLALPAGCGRNSPVDSILLVTIDTLRTDHVSCYGPSPVETPTLDRLARDGARVARAWTSVPLTAPAHATIMTGLYPPGHGVRTNTRFRLPERAPTLASRLKQAGLKTAAFVSSFTASTHFGLNQGFEHFDEAMGADASGRRRSERPADETVDLAAGWLAQNAGRPFFVWVHLFDPHTPYAPPPEYAARYPGDPYSGEVAFADAQVGRLLAALETSGAARRTAIAVLSDHGEGLGSHGEPEHGLLLYEEALSVPMIFTSPAGIAPGSVLEGPASTVDVVPTLLGLLGLPSPDRIHGRDLFGPGADDRPLYAETLYPHEEFRWSALYAVRRGDTKYIEAPTPELYELRSDPGEARNVASERPDEARTWSDRLRTVAGGIVDREMLAEAAGLGGGDEESIERLKSLGYVAGGADIGTGTVEDSPVVGGPDPKERMADYQEYVAAEKLLDSGEPTLAADRLERLATRDPDNPLLALTLARAQERAGRDALAEAAYRNLLARHQTSFLAYLAFGDFLMARKRIDDARTLWIDLMRLLPEGIGIEVSIARRAIAAGLADDASRRLRSYVEARPNDPEGWAVLGRAQAATGDGAGAMQSFRRAIDLQPTQPDAIDGAVTLLLQQGRSDDARKLVDDLLRRNPTNPLLQRLQRAL